MELFLRGRRPAALLIVAALVVVAIAVPVWCAVTGTWGW